MTCANSVERGSWTQFASIGLDSTPLVSRFVYRFCVPPRPVRIGMTRQKHLTPSSIDAMVCVPILDPETRGLRIEPLPSGRKRWLFRRRISRSGTVLKQSLGVFPALSIADARELARKLNDEIEAGLDPRVTRREEQRR